MISSRLLGVVRVTSTFQLALHPTEVRISFGYLLFVLLMLVMLLTRYVDELDDLAIIGRDKAFVELVKVGWDWKTIRTMDQRKIEMGIGRNER